MNQWQEIYDVLSQEKTKASKSYKCINKNATIKIETVVKHLNIILKALKRIRQVINTTDRILTKEHQKEVRQFFFAVRDKLVSSLARHNIEVTIPTTVEEKLQIDFNSILSERAQSPIPSPSLSQTPSVEEKKPLGIPIINVTMVQTVVEFVKTASSVLPEFDGKPENLHSFLDALDILDQINDDHEALAITMIKTKLKGMERNFISTENTIELIKTK
ncbi:PREDICTED: uncharacterized protein LOC108368398 [Rhagoletis zephyria]|uniref:uncharacterized protein LOC108368398 n=1 Tax=Rhagoletis zephyria TaxID=28612 RepID=UPI00081141A0|nr:PREDICTED: uncharacterized protein LOC108368398 [Rhagoletis zephyria]